MNQLPRPAPPKFKSRKEMKDLRGACVQVGKEVERPKKIHGRDLEALIPWVDALRRQVDARLDHARKEEE
jgi:hypothetical protein